MPGRSETEEPWDDIVHSPTLLISRDGLQYINIVEEADGTYSLPIRLVGVGADVAISNANVIASSTDSSVIVGIASVLVLAANANRKNAVITNISDTIIYLKRGGAAVLETGIPLFPNWVYEINNNNLFRGDIYAISSAANKKLTTSDGI